MVYSQGVDSVGVQVLALAEVSGVGVQPEPEQLHSVTVPAAKLLICWPPVELNSAKLVEIDSAAKSPTAPRAARAKRRLPLRIT
jgi:hypothetical protein